jgi:hypothetical protein
MTTLVRRDTSGSGFVILAIVIAAGLGALTAIAPLLGVGAGLAAFVAWLLSYGKRMIPVFHVGLVIILIGYAFLGKGMAYVGVAPIYVGEMVLVLALLAIAVSVSGARWHPFHLVLLAFMAWGLIRTVPYIAIYDIDALRDGVSWGYGVFAIAVSLTVRREHIDQLLRLYDRFIPWFVFWVPIAAILYVTAADIMPTAPGSSEPIVSFKAGDAGVHLAGIGAFMVLGLRPSTAGAVKDWVIWAGWLIALGISGAISRGGLLAAAMMATSIVFARNGARWVSLVLVGLFLFAVIGLVNPEVDVGLERKLSFDQVVENAVSVVAGRKDDPVLEGTKAWRLRWWTKIVDYTVDGPYFWYGKGFGVNLADADGFQVNADGSLRAPHNGHLELLARGGVPMLALWILVQVAFGITMLRAALRAHAAGLDRLLKVTGWIIAYWLALLVNASFDVYLQGPMGGIWYWSIIGLGIAVAGFIAREAREAGDGPRAAPTAAGDVPMASGAPLTGAARP